MGLPRTLLLIPSTARQRRRLHIQSQSTTLKFIGHLSLQATTDVQRSLFVRPLLSTSLLLSTILHTNSIFLTSKVYGSYEEGIGEILPATNKARWLKIQFRSNKRKNAGGFRCQFAAVAPFTGTGSGSGSST